MIWVYSFGMGMAHRFEIIPARRSHCGQMARIMRATHREKFLQFGVDPHRRICECFEMSPYCKAWLIDGRLAALGGVEGPIMADSGFVWLVIAQMATKYPIAIIKTARRYLEELMTIKKELLTTVISGDTPALNLAMLLDFHLDRAPSYDTNNVIPLVYRIEENF